MNYSVTYKSYPDGIAKVKKNFKKGLFKMAFNGVAPRARKNAPYRTGALRNSIRVTEQAESVTVLAGGKSPSGPMIPYGLIHELGGWTGRGHALYIRPKHYLGRALDATLKEDFSKYWR